ncbi:hypothetical protein JCM8547_008777 [Rhodosporidiobolus lusitaniae]
MAPKRAPTPVKPPVPSQAALAAPAWRQFNLFNSSPHSPVSPSSSSPPLVAHPSASISTLHSAPSLGDGGIVLLADLDGKLHLLNEQWEAERSWTAYDGGRAMLVETASWDSRKGRIVVVTVGDDRSSTFPILKVWLLTLPLTSPAVAATSSGLPPLPHDEPHLTLLRSAPINPNPSRPSPVSSLALAPSLSHVVLGLADGSVIAFKRLEELIETSLNELEDAVARAAEPPPSSSSRGAAPPKPRPFVVGSLGKLRVLWEGNHEPVTSVGITSASPPSFGLQTLFILTTSQILSLPLPVSRSPAASQSKYKHAQASVLDDHGAAVGCAKVLRLGVPGEEGDGAVQERMVVARDEAVYVYGAEGREGCWAYEGPKSSISPLTTSFSQSSTPSLSSTSKLPTPYLVILTPPQRSSLTSTSATIRAHASSRPSPSPASPAPGAASGGDEKVGKVTIFDPENKFVAFSAPYGDAAAGAGSSEAGVREVVEAWGAIWVLTESGKLYRLTEQPLSASLAQLYQRNLYTLAVSLAQSRGLSSSEVAEIYRRYGDHLYSKADYEGAMSCYLKTVGVVQASYVIRKFLDAQRLTHLTTYLQELHSRSLANSDITTLLLNCYTKLGDSAALEAFIHSSSSSSYSDSRGENGADERGEPPFDLETAIRVLRAASYFHHAAWLAKRYALHGEYLRIALEDEHDYARALQYVRELAASKNEEEREEAREGMRRWAGVLLREEPEETTRVLVEVCGGPEQKEEQAEERVEPNGKGGGKGRVADLRENGANGGGYDVPHSSSTPPPPSSTGSPTFSPRASFAGDFPSSTSAPPVPSLPSPRLFFPHYVDHPAQFIAFLEAIVARRYGLSVDSLPPSEGLVRADAPLPEPKTPEEVEAEEEERSGDKRDESVVWNTLLELYVSPSFSPPSTSTSAAEAETEQQLAQRHAKAMRLLRAKNRVPYDSTQALLVCTTKGFEDGFVALYEMEGRYEGVVRYYIDASLSSPSSSTYSSRLISSLRRYGPTQPSLYALVLRHLTSTASLLSRHQSDVLELLKEVDDQRAMVPVEVVRVLSEGGVAGLAVVSEYLKRQLTREKEEIDSDLALITSYRTESAKKRVEMRELSDPTKPRVFQVTRCAACGGTLEPPMVHFMCRHSYHQRCLPDSSPNQCPNCALTHGVTREIRRSNAQLAGKHDLFLQEVEESDDGFKAMAGAFGRGVMGTGIGVGVGESAV